MHSHPAATNSAPAAADLGAEVPPENVGTLHLYRRMWQHAAGARGWLLLSSAMLVASPLLKLALPWVTAQAIDLLQRAASSGTPLAACLPWVAAIVGLCAASWALHGPGRVLERTVALRVRRALSRALYARLAGAPLAWHGTHHPAELAHRMSQATQALSNFTQSQFIYLQNGVSLVGPIVALTWLSLPTGGVAVAGMLVVAGTIVAFDRALMHHARVENDAERRHGAALVDCLSNILTVLSLRLQGTTERLLARRLAAVEAPLVRNITLLEWKWCAVDLLSIALTWGLVALYAWQARDAGALLLGSVFMVYQYAQQSSGVIGSLAGNLQNFARIRTDYASAAPIWAAPRTPREAHEAVLPAGWHHVDLCDLACAYPSDGAAPRAGLRKLSLRLHAGERIALVGPSGAGKSTLLRLIAGLIEPTHGHIEVDGVAPLARRGLGGDATLIPQEAQVFEASLRENLAFDHAHSAQEIDAAARVAALDEVIAALPRGLDSPIAQGGTNLSGGQRQRLCLARGVLAAGLKKQGSSVLLLDEPTSALDPVTEAAIYARLDAAFPEACIVASVHRMSLLDRFDRVALIVQGELIDIGTPAELRARQPLFRAMLGAEAAADEAPAPRHSDQT